MCRNAGLLPVIFLSLSACTTLSTQQTARVIPKGTSRIGVGVTGGYNLVGGDYERLPIVEASYRYGLADRVDVGIRVRPISGLAEVKFQFWDAGRIYASFGPGVGFGGFAQTLGLPSPGSGVSASASKTFTEFAVHAPIYFGGLIGRSAEWTAGPALVGRYSTRSLGVTVESMSIAGESSSFRLFAGGVASIALAISRRWSLYAEANLYEDMTETTGAAGEFGGGFFIDLGRP